MWYIYKITNTLTNKKYIGQRKLRKNKSPYTDNYMGSGTYIKKSILKYGIENFTKEVLKSDIESQNESNDFEILYVKEYNTLVPNGYNLTNGGCSISGYKHSEDTKQKMSLKSKGIKKSIEHNKKNSESHKGQIISDETKKKISDKLKGIKKTPLSEETKKKISDKLKDRKLPDDVKEKIRNSILGQKRTNETKENISKSLKGKKKTKEHIAAMRKSRVYTKLTNEQKDKISKSMKKYHKEKSKNFLLSEK